MLVQTNSSLEEDRRSSVDQVSLLFSQYHELLTRVLMDKEHYHSEEKVYVWVYFRFFHSRNQAFLIGWKFLLRFSVNFA